MPRPVLKIFFTVNLYLILYSRREGRFFRSAKFCLKKYSSIDKSAQVHNPKQRSLNAAIGRLFASHHSQGRNAQRTSREKKSEITEILFVRHASTSLNCRLLWVWRNGGAENGLEPPRKHTATGICCPLALMNGSSSHFQSCRRQFRTGVAAIDVPWARQIVCVHIVRVFFLCMLHFRRIKWRQSFIIFFLFFRSFSTATLWKTFHQWKWYLVWVKHDFGLPVLHVFEKTRSLLATKRKWLQRKKNTDYISAWS